MDFSERRSEEVISFFWCSVYVSTLFRSKNFQDFNDFASWVDITREFFLNFSTSTVVLRTALPQLGQLPHQIIENKAQLLPKQDHCSLGLLPRYRQLPARTTPNQSLGPVKPYLCYIEICHYIRVAKTRKYNNKNELLIYNCQENYFVISGIMLYQYFFITRVHCTFIWKCGKAKLIHWAKFLLSQFWATFPWYPVQSTCPNDWLQLHAQWASLGQIVPEKSTLFRSVFQDFNCHFDHGLLPVIVASFSDLQWFLGQGPHLGQVRTR